MPNNISWSGIVTTVIGAGVIAMAALLFDISNTVTILSERDMRQAAELRTIARRIRVIELKLARSGVVFGRDRGVTGAVPSSRTNAPHPLGAVQ